MQGIGPENLVVHNCRNLSQRIPLETDQSLRQRQLRLLRNLQNLFIKFQLEAGEQVRAWVNDDGSVDFFEEADTDAGSSLHEEGEENEKTNDDFQPGGNIDRDRDGRPDGDGGDREGPARGSRSSSATLLAELGI